MKFNTPKVNLSNGISVLIIVLLLVPQTRHFFQLQLNKLFSLIPPSVEVRTERRKISDFNFKLKSIDGDFYNLQHIEYKTAIVSFWATWCPPCIAELSSLQQLYNDYGDKVEFVFISNEKLEVLNAFLKKNGYDFPVYIVQEEAKDIYFKPRTIPRTLLINRGKEVVIIEEGAKNWNSKKVRDVLDKLLNGEIVY